MHRVYRSRVQSPLQSGSFRNVLAIIKAWIISKEGQWRAEILGADSDTQKPQGRLRWWAKSGTTLGRTGTKEEMGTHVNDEHSDEETEEAAPELH